MSKSSRRKARISKPDVKATADRNGKSWRVILLLDVLFIALLTLLPIPKAASAWAVGLLLVWQVALYLSSSSPFQLEWKFRKPHWVQTALQLLLYTYWGLYWDEVARFAPLIVVQLVFAYLFDILLACSRKKTWHGGLGQFPVVLSINLFLWFQPQQFFCQFLLISLAYLGKEFVTWTYNGRKKHIFNPSGFALALVGIVLLVTRLYNPEIDHSNRAVDIVDSFSLAPNFYEVVFLLSLVVQFLFGTTLVTLGAAFAICTMYTAGDAIAGTPLFEVALNRSVFLGISLLVTDPSTSPQIGTGEVPVWTRLRERHLPHRCRVSLHATADPIRQDPAGSGRQPARSLA